MPQAEAPRLRPGSMPAFIREQALLPEQEIDWIIANAPADLLAFH
jgi:hypothetical protein